MAKTLRAGVIGSGVFGGYHAGKYVAANGADLAAVFDVDAGAAKAGGEKHGVPGYDNLEHFLSAVDIVTIASPAATHFKMAKACLSAGKPVLIEKPIAHSLEEARALTALAEEKNLMLAIGHQERLVFDAMGLLDAPESPLAIKAARMGPWSPRGSDVSVTLDLMVHDADLVLALFGRPKATQITANATAEKTKFPDAITTDIEFDGRQRAQLTASRIHGERERHMEIIYPRGTLKIDFVARTFENNTGFALNENYADTPGGQDPLGANVQHFIDAVSGKRKRPAVTGQEGLEALALILAIDEAAGFKL